MASIYLFFQSQYGISPLNATYYTPIPTMTLAGQNSLKTNAGGRSEAKRQGQEALLLKVMGSYIGPAPRGSVSLGADHLNSPQTMRAVLDVIAPQGYPGGHALMADEIHHGSRDSLTMRMLWLLIYLETNNMVHRFYEITGCNINFLRPGKTLDFLRQTGFLTQANIAWLATSAGHTNQSFLKRLLDHVIFDENSIDVLGWLVPDYFNISHSVKAPDYFYSTFSSPTLRHSNSRQSWPLLYASSRAGNTKAVRLLLKLGAEDMYETIGPLDCSPLECAARLEPEDDALIITDLLLSKPAGSSPQCQMKALEGALEEAIRRTHTNLISRLLSEFERRGHGTISSRYATLAAEYADCDTIRLLVNQNLRRGSGSINLPGTILFSAIIGSEEVGLDCLIEKITYLLSCGADPAVPRCENGCGRGFILDYVILFSDREDNEGENAALSLAELLRKHGCPPVRPKPVSGPDYHPSALQRAICLGYPRLTEYLLDWGVDIDHYREGFDEVCVNCDVHGDVSLDDDIYGCSPLLTALEYGQTEIAKMLLKRNPNLKLHGSERHLAVELDDTELLTTLLQAGSTDVEQWSKLLTTAISCKSPKSTRMLLSMSHKDYAFIDTSTIVQASLLIGDTKSAFQQAAFCNYNSQILFEAVLQSHTSKDYHKIVERILNGRHPSPNDDFELCAVASAAIHNDEYLMHILMKCMWQGPWFARFPYIRESYHAEDGNLSRWNLDHHRGDRQTHILNYAAELDNYRKDSTVLQTMLKFGVTANGMYLDISDGLTAESWKQLIDAGADADSNYRHPIHSAARMNMLAHVKVLCEAGVPLNTVLYRYAGGEGSRAAVQCAVESGSPKMLQLLLDYGAQVECPAGLNRGATCLQLAAGAGDIGLVCLLLDKGAKVNAKRALISGRTAIEIAAERGRLEVLKLLLLRGEQLFQTAAERYQFIRAASLAEWEGHEPIVEVLRQHINWNGNDQRLFEQSKKLYDDWNKAYLDDMTEKFLDSERQEADLYALRELIRLSMKCESAYDVPGIIEWLGESTEEEADDNQTGELRSVYQHAQDDLGVRTNLCGDLAGEHSARQTHAWGSGAEMRESLHTPSAQAFHYQDSSPTWVEMQDYDVDMMQDLSGGLGGLGRTCKSLAFGTETQNLNQEPGMVLGEVMIEEDYSQLTLDHEFDMNQGRLWDMGDLDRTFESLGLGIETQNMNQEPGIGLEDVMGEEDHSQPTSGHELASAYFDDWWI